MPSQSHLSKAKILATPTDTPYHALFASPRASPARSWQQMMRARLGIDKTKSWADWAEEEEEAAEPTNTPAILWGAAMTRSSNTSGALAALPSTKTAVSASPAGVARALLASKVKTPRDPTLTPHGTPP